MLTPILALTCSLTTPRAEDIAELVAAARRRINQLDSFVATYSIESPKQKGVLSLIYEAPDHARVRMEAGDTSATTWMLGERMAMRGDLDGAEEHADFELEPIYALDRAFDEHFPSPTPDPNDAGPGAVIDLGFVPVEKGSAENTLKLQIRRLEHRAAVVAWLWDSKMWSDARHEDGRLVLEPSAGTSLTLAVESGFLEAMQYPGLQGQVTVKLLSLAVDEDIPASVFVVPARRDGVTDQSAERQRDLTLQSARFFRRRLHGLGKDEGLTARYDESALRAKLVPLSEALHALIMADTCAEWSKDVAASRASFIDGWRVEYEKARGDETARETLKKIASERRAGLVKAIASSRAWQQESLKSPTDSTSSTAALILECEREGAGRAFDEHVGEPMLRGFDEALDAVVGDG